MLTLPRVLATGNGAVERGSGRGKEVPCSKARENGSPRVKSDPRRKEVTIARKSRENAIGAEQRDTGPADAAPPNTSLTFTNRVRIKVNMSPTSSLSLKAQKRDDIVIGANDGDVHLDGSEDLLDDMDIYGDLQ
jgi:hypothetical protein